MKIRIFRLRHLIREAIRENSLMLEAIGDKCLNCGTPIEEEDDSFCGECGCNVSKECVSIKCNAVLSVEDEYCGECGAPQMRKDPKASENIQKIHVLKKRNKLWKDAGGEEIGDEQVNRATDDYEQALENKIIARTSRDPKLEEFKDKFKEARHAWHACIRKYVAVRRKYLVSLVKAGVATDDEKKLANELTQSYEKYDSEKKKLDSEKVAREDELTQTIEKFRNDTRSRMLAKS